MDKRRIYFKVWLYIYILPILPRPSLETVIVYVVNRTIGPAIGLPDQARVVLRY
jgi:hypothetical protein